ncbi:hypothetical protein COOONC_18759 [Cooperia oncophora]
MLRRCLCLYSGSVRSFTMPKRKAKVLTTYFESKKTKISVDVDEPQPSTGNEIRGDEEERHWKFLCWNVAGLRACAKKGGHKSVLAEDPDVMFLGETKCSEWPVDLESAFRAKGYHRTLLVSQKNKGGYAGVAFLSKVKPLKVRCC